MPLIKCRAIFEGHADVFIEWFSSSVVTARRQGVCVEGLVGPKMHCLGRFLENQEFACTKKHGNV